MKAEGLLAHYEQIADAPDAIVRLRRFILDLAVRGKLVPQDASDELASELLKRIAREKAQLVNAGETRKFIGLEAVTLDEQPFDIPQTWQWVRLGDILTKLTDGTHHSPPNEPTGDFKYITAKNIKNEGVLLDDVTYVSRKVHDEIFARCNPAKGDILYIKDGATTGVVTINDLDEQFSMLSSVALLKLPTCIFNRLAVEFLRSPFFYNQMRGFMKGAAITRVTLKRMGPALIPLPPLAEQHRIVAKVDELMALCDRLEAARASREAARDRLAAASLARLNAPDPETFQADARFALDVLPALTTRPDQIRALRQTILNLAVRGKLVPQDPKDEPASELLKRIAVERAELVTKKEIRREDPLDPIQSAQMPFDVAAGWVWSRIGEAVLFTQYGTSQKSNPSEKGVPVLTMGNVQDGLVVCSNEKRIPETSEDLPTLYLRKFDILYNRTNSAELVGKTGIYLGDDGVRTFASYLIRLRPSLLSSNPRFLNMAMNTPEFRETQIIPLIKKQTGQANVNGTALKNMLIPLPPLAEQRRIVAKIDALMALCDRLEASLAATAVVRRRLLDALLAEALAPAADYRREAAE
jgi:type I restriction enzyme, S subunit